MGNKCIANPYFYCVNAFYNHQNGDIELVLGQNTGINWTSVNFVFVHEGTALNNGMPEISFISYPANTMYAKNGTKSGEALNISLPVKNNVSVKVGTTAVGFIWVKYIKENNSTPQYTQIASINIRAS